MQAIAAAFGIDERTVTTWQQKAGRHAKRVQETIVHQGTVDGVSAVASWLTLQQPCSIARAPCQA